MGQIKVLLHHGIQFVCGILAVIWIFYVQYLMTALCSGSHCRNISEMKFFNVAKTINY